MTLRSLGHAGREAVVAAPLSTGFFLTSILGFIFSVTYIYELSETWGFTLALFFTIMFISSFVSMSRMTINQRFDIEERMLMPMERYYERKNKKNLNRP